jgi:hypothetical protein
VSDARGSQARCVLFEGLGRVPGLRSVRRRTEPRLSWSCTTLRSRCPRRASTRIGLGAPPHALCRSLGGAPGSSHGAASGTARESSTGRLPWAYALLQSPPDSEPPNDLRRLRRDPQDRSAPPMRSAPLQRFPAHSSSFGGRDCQVPSRLRPQVFSTSRRLHPPRACRPCFMPDPLMGLRPSELCSPRQAVRRLRRLMPS